MITGGEPLMHPKLSDLMAYAAHELGFPEISLITNGTLLSLNRGLLPLLDNLIISLDSVDPQDLSKVSLPDAYAETVMANAREAACSRCACRACRAQQARITRQSTSPHP